MSLKRPLQCSENFWRGRWALMILTVAVTGFIFFKNKKTTFEKTPSFQIAPPIAEASAAPFYQEEVIDPKETYRMEPYQALIGRLLSSVDKSPAYEGKVITGGKLNIYKALTQIYTPLYPALAPQ